MLIRPGPVAACVNTEACGVVCQRMKMTEQVDTLQAQKDRLQSLSRQLQMERNDLRKELAAAQAAGAPATPPPSATPNAAAELD